MHPPPLLSCHVEYLKWYIFVKVRCLQAFKINDFFSNNNKKKSIDSYKPLPIERTGRVKNIRVVFFLPENSTNLEGSLEDSSNESYQYFFPDVKTAIFTGKNVEKYEDFIINLSFDQSP